MHDLALLTRHEKHRVLTAPLAQAGYALTLIDSYDTDQLGTFCGAVPRLDSQIETAIHKAKLAAQLGLCRYGLGSEGAFGPDPYLGMTAWTTEVLAWWDAERDYAVLAHVATHETNFAHAQVTEWAAAQAFAAQIGFPEHALMVGTPERKMLYKGLRSLDELEAAVQAGLAAHGACWLETDMRAHLNPTRMGIIARCGERLADQLLSPCPSCHRPGFAAHRPVPGARCRDCGEVTRIARAEIWRCPACTFESEIPLDASAGPEHCDHCNP